MKTHQNAWRPQIEGVLLSLFFGVAYYITFFIQGALAPFVEYAQGIAWVFIPAGIKLVAFMVAGGWGFLGIAVVGLITAFDVWHGVNFMVHIGNIAVWAGVPYLTYRGIARLLGVGSDLRNLQYWHVLVIAFVTTMTSSIGSSLYQWMLHGRGANETASASLAMAIGDFCGIGLSVFALAFLVHWRDRKTQLT